MRQVVLVGGLVVLVVCAWNSVDSAPQRSARQDGGQFGLFPQIGGVFSAIRGIRDRVQNRQDEIASEIFKPFLGGQALRRRQQNKDKTSTTNEAEEPENNEPNKDKPTSTTTEADVTEKRQRNKDKPTSTTEADVTEKPQRNKGKRTSTSTTEADDSDEVSSPGPKNSSTPPSLIPRNAEEPDNEKSPEEEEDASSGDSAKNQQKQKQNKSTSPAANTPTTEDWSNAVPEEAKEGITNFKKKLISAPCLGGTTHDGCRAAFN